MHCSVSVKSVNVSVWSYRTVS